MKIIHYSNRIAITFKIGNEYANEISRICKKYNAQDGLYDNQIASTTLSHDRSHWIKGGEPIIGGTITFHSHSCDPLIATLELITFLKSKGLVINEELKEVTKTHRDKATYLHPIGSPYKITQTFLEPITIFKPL